VAGIGSAALTGVDEPDRHRDGSARFEIKDTNWHRAENELTEECEWKPGDQNEWSRVPPVATDQAELVGQLFPEKTGTSIRLSLIGPERVTAIEAKKKEISERRNNDREGGYCLPLVGPEPPTSSADKKFFR
jgi:hypothetical protein